MAAVPAQAEAPEVAKDQVWADNDPRSKGRTLKVLAVTDSKAVCEVLTDADNTKRSQVGQVTRISLHRFKPTASGYRLVKKPRKR